MTGRYLNQPRHYIIPGYYALCYVGLHQAYHELNALSIAVPAQGSTAKKRPAIRPRHPENIALTWRYP